MNYATSRFDVGKTHSSLHLPLKPNATNKTRNVQSFRQIPLQILVEKT